MSELNHAYQHLQEMLMNTHLLLIRTTLDRLENKTLTRQEAEARLNRIVKDAHHA